MWIMDYGNRVGAGGRGGGRSEYRSEKAEDNDGLDQVVAANGQTEDMF